MADTFKKGLRKRRELGATRGATPGKSLALWRRMKRDWGGGGEILIHVLHDTLDPDSAVCFFFLM